jgi:hypothetical protein
MPPSPVYGSEELGCSREFSMSQSKRCLNPLVQCSVKMR